MLLNKTVKHIEHDDSGVTVHCEDGSTHRADIVVGCDGVNSKASVRSEMLRIASKAEPGFFADSEINSENEHDRRRGRRALTERQR